MPARPITDLDAAGSATDAMILPVVVPGEGDDDDTGARVTVAQVRAPLVTSIASEATTRAAADTAEATARASGDATNAAAAAAAQAAADAAMPKAGGTFTGAVVVPTASADGHPVTKLAHDTALAAKAPLASPALTGTPTAPTAAAATDSTQIATTEWVRDATYSSLGARTVEAKLGEVVSVKDVGATGDGVTSDTTALNAALVAGTYYLPAGTYRAPGLTVTQTSALALIGAGRGLTIIDGERVAFGLSVTHVTVRARLYLKGLTFKNFDKLLVLDGFSSDISEIHFEDCDFDTLGSPLIWSDSDDSDAWLRKITVKDCTATTLSRGFFLNAFKLQRATFERVDIKTVKKVGIQAGYAGGSTGSTPEFISVTHCTIEGVSANSGAVDGTDSVNGIVASGDQVIIDHNQIRDLTSTLISDNEGIYCKLIHGSVSHNTLVNAGLDEGAIAVKGQPRAGGGTGPDGKQVIIDHNIIDGQDAAGSSGILVYCDDAIVSNNSVTGVRNKGIYVSSSLQWRNITIKDNSVYNCRAQYPIMVQGWAKLVVIDGNLVDQIDGTTDAYAENYGIYIEPFTGALSHVRLLNNTIQDLTGTSVRPVYVKTSFSGSLPVFDFENNAIIDEGSLFFTGSGNFRVARANIHGNTFNGSSARIACVSSSYKPVVITIGLDNDTVANEVSGTGTITNGGTSVTITHGLFQITSASSAPAASDIAIVPTQVTGYARLAVTAVSATQFTVTADAAVSEDVSFGWRIRRTVY
jgi:hypothetical protein